MPVPLSSILSRLSAVTSMAQAGRQASEEAIESLREFEVTVHLSRIIGAPVERYHY